MLWTWWIFGLLWPCLWCVYLAVDFPSECLPGMCCPSVVSAWLAILLLLGVLLAVLVKKAWDWTFRICSGVTSRLHVDKLPVRKAQHGRLVRAWLWWLLVFCHLRVGEASHPGPEWSFGVGNLNGLNSKAFGLVESPVDTWLFSETHLTAPGEKVFRANLREAQAPYKAFVGGSPVPARSTVSDIGQFSGVGVLSKFPVRRLPHAWPEIAFRSGRLVCVSVFCQGIWVSGVVVYGTPTGGTHSHGKEVTNQLLELALDRVNQLSGPRFLAGDWNHDLDKLSSVSVMQRLGFQDCQDVRASQTGILPQATCRGKTRRDYMFMSRELINLFVRCEVDDETVSDHASLVCFFNGGINPLRFAWPIPDQMEWESPEHRTPVAGQFFHGASQVSSDYAQFWNDLEQSNQEARRRLKKPIVRAMTGRAAVRSPQVRLVQIPPLKASRPGDGQPLFLGSCLQHVQWTKQLRRLQSYIRLAQAPFSTRAHVVHRLQLWTSIRNSRGFAPSFPAWWTSRCLGVGEPGSVPVEPPTADVATLFYLGLEVELSGLESCLKSTRSHAKRLMRASDAHAIYGAVKRDAPAQVDTLVETTSGVVAEVDHDECAVVLEHPIQLRSDAPLVHEEGTLQIIHHEDDKVWIDSCHGLEPGCQVWQKKPIGRIEDLFQAFESQWSLLWNKHADLAPSQWDDILDFARQNLRPVVVSSPTFTVSSFMRCVRRKSRHSAVSLDGVSRADLLALHPSEVTTLLQVYRHAAESGAWPSQTLCGYVRSLAKTGSPEEVSHFRPITVFSLIYRIWSSLTAKHWLMALSKVVDPYLFGSTTGGRASHVWRHVLESVESAHWGQDHACGFVADIVKAYNDLPRLPALTAAKLLGVDQGTLCAWAGALAGFRRHFVIQGSYSPGIHSTNGFPEGCAMSCVAMVVLTDLFHKWVRAAGMMFRPVSYVDNWAILMQSPAHMQQACQAVDRFANMLQIRLDAHKSFTWSRDREGRRDLRAQGFRVLHSTRDLGAHVVYTRHLANGTTLDRFKGLDDFWAKLRGATCSFQQKVTLTIRAAWPRAMHAVSAVVIGKKHFESLRTAFMNALNLQKPGSSPDLQCCLERLIVDPQVYAALETVRDARSLGCHSKVALDLDQGPLCPDCPTFNSLSEILCQRLHQLGFQVSHNAVAQDSIGLFSFLTCGFGEFLFRCQCAWISVVASRVAHRPSFADFALVDVRHTRHEYLTASGFDQGVLRKFLNGASFTNAHAYRWSVTGNDKCLLCGQADSNWHRLWECPAAAGLRASLPEGCLDLVRLAPPVVSVHGWTLRSSKDVEWWQYLDGLPNDPQLPEVPPPGPILDLFTDGSCLFPTDPDCRVAAYSVVHAAPFCLDYTQACFRPLVAQPLAGVIQSAFRAELKAIVVALRIARKFRVWVRIWSDSGSAIALFHKHVLDCVPVSFNSKHSDLLHEMVHLAADIGPEKIAILKVPAHEDKAAFTTELEHWLLDGNAAADHAARWANQARPPAAWQLWNDHVQSLYANRQLASLVRRHMINVGRLWKDSPGAAPQRESDPLVLRAPRPARVQPALHWNSPDPIVLCKPSFSRLFSPALASDVQRWISSIRDPNVPLRWISFIHLFVSFVRQCGPIDISKQDGHWKIHRGEVARLGNHTKFSLRAKWFRLMLQQYLRDCQVEFVTATVRPFSQWVCCFRGAIGFHLSEAEFRFVEGVIGQQLGSPAVGSGKSLEGLRG